MKQAAIAFSSAEHAEKAFYRAFETNDLDTMIAVWDESDDVVCVHPMGPILSGRNAVIESWREILSGGVSMKFSLESVHTFCAEAYAIHLLNEHISVASGNRVAPMAATNIFRLGPRGWRMVSHHASPNPGPQRENTHALLH